MNQQIHVWTFIDEISSANPIYVSAHPLDILEQVAAFAGVTFTNVSAIKANALPGLRLVMRITDAQDYVDFEEQVFQHFGLNKKPNGGDWDLVYTREPQTVSETITVNDLRDPDARVWSINESSILNRIVWESERIESVLPDVSFTHTHEVESEDLDNVGVVAREQRMSLPGSIYFEDGDNLAVLEDWQELQSREMFNRYLRGGIVTELNCTPDVEAQAGEEVKVELAWLPVPTVGASPVSQRGGGRRMLVLRRTETPEGPDLRLVDTGEDTTVALTPALTLAADSDNPREYVVATITNVATLNAVTGLYLNVRWNPDNTTTSPYGFGFKNTALAPSIPSTIRLGPFPVGTNVGVQVVAHKQGQVGGSVSTRQTQQLDGIDAPSYVSVTPSDGSALVEWVAGDLAAHTLVSLREDVSPDPGDVANIITELVPPGVRFIELSTPAADDYIVTLQHVLGLARSDAVEEAFTAQAASHTPDAATAPRVFRSGASVEARVRVFPSTTVPGPFQVQFQMALEEWIVW